MTAKGSKSKYRQLIIKHGEYFGVLLSRCFVFWAGWGASTSLVTFVTSMADGKNEEQKASCLCTPRLKKVSGAGGVGLVTKFHGDT